MADIKNINFGGIVPDKRMTAVDGKAVEIKRTYKVVNGAGVIIWDIGNTPEPPAVNEFILLYQTAKYNGQYYAVAPKIEESATSHKGVIEWGDGKSDTYSSDTRYMHYYDSAGTYTVKIYAPIENIINAPTGYKYLFSNVQAVIFPDSLISIGAYAFANNPIKSDIDFNNVETISAYAFSGDSAVYGDTISELYGKEVVKIMDSAFYKKRYLTKIDFPKVEHISNSSFSYCTKLTDVNIPSVKWIASYAFQNCTSLESIEIPDTIEEISYNNGLATNAFEGCSNLKSIIINKPLNSVAGAPWGATNAQVLWRG